MPSRQVVVAFAGAAVLASIAASVSSTQFVIAALGAIDVDVPLSTRLIMTVEDLAILRTLLPATVACFLPAFWVAEAAATALGGNRSLWLALAGGTALVAEILIIEAALGLMPIGGARTVAGLAMQGVAGALGGIVFARLAPSRAVNVAAQCAG